MGKIETSVFLMLFIMANVVSCKRVAEVDLRQLSDLAEFKLGVEKHILVVPQNGCSTCVKKSYEFILRHYDSDDVKYVFTHYSSKKAVKVRFRVLGIDDTSRLGFVELSDALELGLSQMFPSLIEVKEGGVGDVIFMNAEDGSDWKRLEEGLLDSSGGSF